MKLSHPVAVKVLERRENGSGVVEVPVLPVSDIDLGRTAGGGKGRVKVTRAVLEEIAANFARFPGPVPIGVHPHQDFEDRGGFSPGFVNSVEVRGDALVAQLDLIAPLFFEVESGGWRGFSVELARDLKTPTVELAGWVLTGGVFTNRPATDVNFKIAASGKTEAAERLASFQALERERQGGTMSDDRIASLEAELKTQNELVTSLRAQTETMSSEQTTLEARLTEANKDLSAANIALSEAKAKLAATEDELGHLRKTLSKEQQNRREIEVKLEAEQNRSLRDAVLELAQKAIDRGVSAKHFEAIEEDPVAWFNKRFVSLEALTQFVEALPTVNQSAVRSGSRKSDQTAKLSEEHATRLRRLGLNTKYVGITSEDDLLELREREQNSNK